MKHLLAIAFITLLALGTGCAWISPSSQTTSDGIQVHGHWTVTVTNPDGTLDAVHEFDNALTDKGTITNLILGLNNMDKTYIRLLNPSPTNSLNCLEQYGTSGSDNQLWLEALSTIEVSAGLPFILSATCTVLTTPPEDTQEISQVMTYISDANNCFNRWSPSSGTACGGTPIQTTSGQTWILIGSLTEHTFSPRLSVSNGQQIGFNVKISFQ